MKRLSALAVIACVVCIWNVGCSAQEQTPDKRLEQKVVVKAVACPLGDFLAEQSAKTCVKMTARADVADDKLVVLVKDLPLSEIQSAIKEVLHLQCTRSGKKGEWKYKFWMDLKTRQEMDKLKSRDLEELKKLTNKLVKVAEDISDDDLRKLDGNGHIQYIFEDRYTDARNTLRVYRTLNKQQLQTLWQGKKVTVPASQLPPEAMPGLKAAIAVMYQEMGFDLHDTDSKRGDLEVTGITYEVRDSEPAGHPVLDFSINGQTMKSNSGRPAYHTDWDSRGTIDPQDFIDLEAADHVASDAANKDDDNFEFKTEKSASIYRALELLAEQAHISIVGDYFTALSGNKLMPECILQKASPERHLRRAASFLPAKITRADNAYLLTSLDWYRLREGEIPERLLTKWRQLKAEEKKIELDDMMEMARTFSKAQLKNLVSYDLFNGRMIAEAQDSLKLADSLSQEQWDAASSEAGLPLAGLSQAQLKILDEWMAGDPNASPEIMPSLKKGIFRILQARQSNWDCSVRDTEGHWMLGGVSAENDSQGLNGAAEQKIIEPTCEISVKSASEP